MKNRYFPLWPIVDGACSCPKGRDCIVKPGKHPKFRGWQLGESDYIPQQGDQYGILMGEGLFAVDTDTPEAEEYFRSLGDIPRTTIQETGRGKQFLFTTTEQVANDVGRKIHLHADIRGEHGYIVGPGSKHSNGKTYTIIDGTPPAPAPEWLMIRVRMSAAERRAAATTAPTPIDGASEEGQDRIQRCAEYLQTCEPAVQGDFGSSKLFIACATLMRTYCLALDDAKDLIDAVYNPRCEPPWSEQEIVHTLENARDRCDWVCGPPSREFPGNLVRAVNAPTPSPRTQGTRAMKDPNHQYKVKTGDRPNGQRTKITLGQAMAELDTHPDMAGVFSYDESSGLVLATNPPLRLDCEDPNKGLTNADGVDIAAWFELGSTYLVSRDIALAAAESVARNARFHPVRSYLESLPAGDVSLLNNAATVLFGNTEPLVQTFFKKFLVAAVARAFEPGCFVKNMPVIVGDQDAGKSTFCHRLFGQWYKEGISDLKKKDALEELRGQWGIEMGEMKAIRTSDVETYKEFLSRREDKYRASYGKGTGVVPRSCVFIGTGNHVEFLRDVTGDTRFWPIQLPPGWKIPTFDRDAYWAAAVALYRAGYPWWLDEKESEAADELRQAFYEVDEWSGPVSAFMQGRQEVTVRELHEQVILGGDKDLSKLDKRTEMRLADILKRLKAVPCKDRGRRWWRVPADIAAMEMKKTPAMRLVQGGAGK